MYRELLSQLVKAMNLSHTLELSDRPLVHWFDTFDTHVTRLLSEVYYVRVFDGIVCGRLRMYAVAFTSDVNQQHVLLRKEVIQPHLPIRLPCYDFVPLT